jgi:hypothetical protein
LAGAVALKFPEKVEMSAADSGAGFGDAVVAAAFGLGKGAQTANHVTTSPLATFAMPQCGHQTKTQARSGSEAKLGSAAARAVCWLR